MSTDAQKRLLVVLFALGAIAMLLGALGEWPYSYTLLRWVTGFAAVLVAIFGLQWGQLWAVGVFVFVAILFNPFVPIDLSRSIWRLIDIGTAALFLLAILLVKAPGTRDAVTHALLWPGRVVFNQRPIFQALIVVVIGLALGSGYYAYHVYDDWRDGDIISFGLFELNPVPTPTVPTLTSDAVTPFQVPASWEWWRVPMQLGTAYIASGKGHAKAMTT
ncbi:MAG: hypothetical protein HW388_30 [Dehalococcoidia bacterium]|nr:hypothetical protein [Dehalococcoidia bacterium]